MSSTRRGQGPLGWGRLNGGQDYQVLALDVFRALAHAGLNHYEWILIQAVVERSWHVPARRKRHHDDWPDPIPTVINISEFAREILGRDATKSQIETYRKRLYEAKASLIASRMISEAADGLRPMKDAHLWTYPDGVTPRLPAGSLDYALGAQLRRSSRARDRPVPGKPDTPMPGKPDRHTRDSGHTCPENRASPTEARARVDPTGLDIPEDPPGVEQGAPPAADPSLIERLTAERDAQAEPLIRYAETLGSYHDTGRPVAVWAREQVGWLAPQNLWWLWGLLLRKYARPGARPTETVMTAVMHMYRSRLEGPGSEFSEESVRAQRAAMGLLGRGESPPDVPSSDVVPAPSWPATPYESRQAADARRFNDDIRALFPRREANDGSP